MVPKSLLTALVGATLLAWSGLSIADEYRADEFLGLDLSKAALSPKPLGPATQFAPVAIEAGPDSESLVAQAPAEPKADPKIVVPRTKIGTRVETRAAHLRVGKPRGAARTKLARRHSNPLDAQASDTRIQVWPCRSGGICNWQSAPAR